MRQTKNVITEYYNILRKGIDSRIVHVDHFPFDEEISVTTSSYKIVGKNEVFAIYLEAVNVLKNFELKELFLSDNSACAIVEFSLFDNPLPVLTADWFHLKDGKISKIHSIYDTSAWEKIIQT